MKEDSENKNSQEEDMKAILSTITEIKEKLASIDSFPKDTQEDLSKASELIDNVIKKASESYDLENKKNKESSQKAELKDGEKQNVGSPEEKTDSPFKVGMPSPQSGDTIDDFITRCMYDVNSRTLYADTQERFKACMLQGNGFQFRPDKPTPPFAEGGK